MKWPTTQQWQRKVQPTEKYELPAPRLQFTWFPMTKDKSRWVCLYTLVLPLGEHDIRREDRNYKKVRSELFVKIGMTGSEGVAGRSMVRSGEVESPFRDGAHALWDSTALGGLPIYAVCDGVLTNLTHQRAAKGEV